jgi:hypothetical protein
MRVGRDTEVTSGLIDAMRELPTSRAVEHCGETYTISPFDIYAECPRCGEKVKVRSFSGVPEVEDVFDTVFEWMLEPKAKTAALDRMKVIKRESIDED